MPVTKVVPGLGPRGNSTGRVPASVVTKAAVVAYGSTFTSAQPSPPANTKKAGTQRRKPGVVAHE